MDDSLDRQHRERLLGNALDVAVRLGVVALLAVWCFQIVRPFVVPIVWGVIIAVAVQPAFARAVASSGGRRRLCALLFVLLGFALLIGPGAMLTETLVSGAQRVSETLRDGRLEIPPPPDSVASWPFVGERVSAFWALASLNLEAALRQLGPQLKDLSVGFLKIAAGAGFALLQFLFAIVIAGILLVYSEAGYRASRSVAGRLSSKYGERFANLAQSTVRSVARGILGVALIQSLLAGLGFLAVGVPGAGLWALLCLVLSVVQIGPVLVLAPVVVYVFSTADTVTAVVYLVWSVFVAVLDNILKPILLGRGVDVPMVVIFMGAIGGFLSMGIVGLFVGSTVLALGFALLKAWLASAEQEQPARAGPERPGGPE